MDDMVHRDPLSAWMYLRDRGGIEIEGRDEELGQKLLRRLNPAASSLEDALAGVTMEAFARALFEAIHPFVAMFRDILDFFEHAGATRGQDQWTLQVDDIDLELEHFRKWLATWEETGRVRLEVPAIDFDGAWALAPESIVVALVR